MIRHESSIEIHQPVGEVFAFADDLSSGPLWLESCVELRQTSPGPRAVGSTLHYAHRQGGRGGAMDGVVAAYDPPHRIGMRFADPTFEVVIGIACTSSERGTLVTHSVAITPKSLPGKLMTPMIRAGNRKQVERNLSRLKRRLEPAP